MKTIILSLKKFRFFFVSAVALTALLIFQFYFYNVLQRSPADDAKEFDTVLLWWTPFFPTSRTKTCGNSKCLVTSDRIFMNHSKLRALIFYGSSLNPQDLPKRTNVVWGLLHEESPRNNLLLTQKAVLSLFNYSATFSRSSNFPLTFQYLPSLDSLTKKTYFKTFAKKSSYQSQLAPVMYLQSDCSTPTNRDSYVSELMKYIAVDSYGKCLNNKQLPANAGSSVDFMMSDSILELISRYKFSIAFENAVCEDYITEKLWRPLIAGSVPLYVGSPSIKRWLPNNGSAIFPMDFDSPKELASLLNFLKDNETEYNAYLSHKIHQSIDNEELKLAYVTSFFWDVQENDESIVEKFECFLCSKKHFEKNESNIVQGSHYSCPEPVSILTKAFNASNWWHHSFKEATMEAEKIVALVQNVGGDKNK